MTSGSDHNGVERVSAVPAGHDPVRRASPLGSGSLSPAGREAVLAALRDAWARYPSLRLCQLLVNATGRVDPFYVEDGELLAALRAYEREAA